MTKHIICLTDAQNNKVIKNSHIYVEKLGFKPQSRFT